jgi:outer membrane protein
MIFYFLFLIQICSSSVDLKMAYQTASNHMETLKRNDSSLNQAEERKNRAIGTLGPSLSAVGNYLMIDPPPTTGIRAFTLTKQYSSALRLEQPLIRGGSLSAFELTKEDIILQEHLKNFSKISLYQMVINAYYTLYQTEQDLKHLKELNIFSLERVNDLSQRTKVGRARKGELSQAQTQLFTSQAQERQGQMNHLQALKNFLFLTGLSDAKISLSEMLPEKLEPLESYLLKLENRPDLQAGSQEINIADKRVGISKGGHWPNLNLAGNYYLTRTGILEDSQWDVGVSLNFPLFQGGAVNAQVKEAVEIRKSAELNFKESQRTAQRDITILYQNYLDLYEQYHQLKLAVLKAEESYKLSKKDYNFGLINNLELLQSLNLFIETKRNYDRTFALAHMTFKNLEASTGVLP